ncbi:M23 family metallopeptidase [Motiliproteus sp. SC1-56]|uniref:M23 family metallopeptidase n=1 Tax=Motiliproteus sp. SC1-56 TaxID=2799565 RepID=UPI001A8CE5AB|nr:M23 family metallopeptidase [Motiliproteus sp. SC1-56]
MTRLLNVLPLPLLALLAWPAAALELPTHAPVPGGVMHLPLDNTQAEQRPDVRFQDHPVMVVPSEQTEYAEQAPWVALIGLPLSLQPGTTQIWVEGEEVAINVEPKTYKEQRITLKNKRQVNPTPLDLERIQREKVEILQALESWSPSAAPVTRLEKPTEGPYSSPFGLRRFFNDQPRRPHSGLDIAAPRGTPIKAPAPGRVVATGDYFFNGRTVILDHGLGLTTMYCHMEEISVTVGDELDTGDTLGTVGSSGRATGPHLHWGVSLNDARVDPRLFMEDEAQ